MRSGFVGLVAVAVCGVPLAAAASVSPTNMRCAVDVEADVDGGVYSDRELVSVGPAASGGLSAALAAALPDRVGIDALSVSSNKIVFSTDASFSAGGTDYADEDLVAYDVNSGLFSMVLDGSALGIPARADVDAAGYSPASGDIFFSLDVSATLPGAGAVDDSDVIGYDGLSFSHAFDGTTDLQIPAGADLDALYWDDAGWLYFSLDTTATIGGATGDDDDLWAYNVASHTVTLVANGAVETRADLSALDSPVDTDGDWLTDFEEQSGLDEPASTFPGTGTALDPASHASDPLAADTDGDGVEDGGEAACGTDPADTNDVLRLMQVDAPSATNVVLYWQSVPGKTYAIQTTDALTNAFADSAATHVAAASGTNVTSYSDDGAGASSNLYYRVRLAP
ncbi:MAG: hypothetical protein JXR37_15685 [Kiritimatiellae bacterium]|nr:hypothetical protein [Kiritimatiellia bacterium]